MNPNVISEQKGAWINQYAQPPLERLLDVAYVVIKYGLAQYEQAARDAQVPWLAERMGEVGVGLPALSFAETFGQQLAEQANQPGCIGAVINLEEADGQWHTDDGVQTLKLVRKFREVCPDKPLFASIDTRGNRPDYPYQRVLAAQCEGVMPMVYPKAFEQAAQKAVAVSLTALFRDAWRGKPIIPTIQTYDGIGALTVANTMAYLSASSIEGISAYTMGHATTHEWSAFLTTPVIYHRQTPPATVTVTDTVRANLFEARVKYLETLGTLALKGTPDELLAFATFWKAASTL